MISQDSANFAIAVGASAGGIDALTKLVEALPEGAATIVIQHLEPHRHSSLVEILQRNAALPVVEIRSGDPILAGHIHVCPPAAHAEVTDSGFLLVKGDGESQHPIPSIDRLFGSVAERFQERAVGLLLSGTGTDGAMGIKCIKNLGGITLAQSPDDAKFPEMPRTAIHEGGVDRVLPLAELGAELTRIIAELATHAVGLNDANQQQDLEQIISLIRYHTNSDFSLYKRKTIERRLMRRITLLRLETTREYIKYVENHPDDLKALAQDILISVTSFFRDQEAFTALREQFKEYLRHISPTSALRVWVPACSTGEEAYSVAILIAELWGDALFSRKLQIFATDLDDNAITYARRGIYTQAETREIPLEIKKRYFNKEPGGRYEIIKLIRERIVFARQDIVKDPPFSHLDLISCRNLLIYHRTELQNRILNMFHYALKQDGLLFLGKSESLGTNADLYKPLSKKWRIFTKNNGATPQSPRALRSGAVPGEQRNSRLEQAVQTISLDEIVQESILTEFAPPTLLVDERLDILHIRGEVSPWFQLAEGNMGKNVIDFAKEQIRVDLRMAIHKVQRSEESTIVWGLGISSGTDQMLSYDLHVSPLSPKYGRAGHLILSFVPREPPLPSAKPNAVHPDDCEQRIVELEQELATARVQIESIFHELESTNQDLQSLNEELQSANEELQSTNEEMETSNEELQATNEELITVNEELEIKSSELGVANMDLENILRRMGVAMILVDAQIKVKRFTPPASAIFNLMPGDKGQVLPNVGCHINIPNLREDILEVIKTGNTIERFIDAGARVFELRYHPYYDSADHISGALLTFYDSTEVYRREQEFRALAENSPDVVARFSPRGRVLYINGTIERFFELKARDIINQLPSDLGLDKDQCSHLSATLARVEEGQREVALELEVTTTRGARIFETRLVPEFSLTGNVISIMAIAKDITRERRAQRQEKEALEKLNTALESMSDCFFVLDEELKVTYCNEATNVLFDQPPMKILGYHLAAAFPQLNGTGIEHAAKGSLNDKQLHVFETWLDMAECRRWYEVRIYPQRHGLSVYFMDITGQVEAKHKLIASERRFRSIIETAAEGILELSPQGEVLMANESLAQMLQTQANSLLGTSLSSFTDLSESAARELLTGMEEKEKRVRLITLKPRDGREIHALLNLSAFTDETMGLTNCLAMISDISKLLEAQHQLSDTEAKYAALFRNSPLETLIWEYRDEHLILEDFNDKFLAGDALNEGDIKWSTATKLFRHSPEVVTILKSCAASGEYRAAEVTYHPMHRRRARKAHIHCAPLNRSRVQMQVVDITEQRLLEERLRTTHRMEALGTLAGGIAHDFNSSLASIIGFSELTLEELPAGSRLQDNIKEILSAGTHAKELVRQLESFTAQELPERRPVRVAKVLHSVMKFLRATLPSSIDMRLEESGGPLTVSVVPKDFEQALVHLCTNAAQAIGSGGGEIVISISPGIPENPPDGKPRTYAQISVRDNGKGIPPEHMHQIFDPYFTTKPEGAGMGLSVVSGIIEAHGGLLRVHNDPGYGATFTLYLPLSNEAGSSQELPAVDMISGNEEHILLVDDEPQMTRMQSIILKRLGYAVTPFNSSVEALNAFSEAPQKYDLVMTDMMMPKMNGDMLARTIKEIRPDMPVVLCTGYSDKVEEHSGPIPHADHIIGKPINKAKLSHILHDLLAK